uniref:Septin-5-like n=1 Tax=Sinocyclocheilus grahami TaxID=75366 RepID=A0A672KPF7_SINGR
NLAIEDCENAELAYTMRDLPPRAGHSFPGCEMPMMDREPDGSTRPHTPGTPTFTRPMNRSLLDSDPELPRRGQLSSMSSLDSPLSPTRPWGRFDPYDSAEVMSVLCMMHNVDSRISQTVEITKHTVAIEEKGVKLKLTIVDTPGFGDAVNNTESWRAVVDYIDQQFEQYFRDESGLNRKNIQDNRVHCCLYFISPFGHGLRPMDVEFMKMLHEKVNIVLVLAKADSLTPLEVRKMKMKIREEIERFDINIYQFPECDSDDEEFKLQHQELKDSVPFTVIGSNVQVESQGRRFRGRQYPWGVVEVCPTSPAYIQYAHVKHYTVYYIANLGSMIVIAKCELYYPF